jgi:DNA polymerase (family 10)
MKTLTNQELAALLRKVAAAYQILNENRFKIIAYDRAADSIEHLTTEVKDFWEKGKLGDIPGVGQGISMYLDELFRTGHVEHFDDLMTKIPAGVFTLLLVPGLGPKKAYRLVKELDLTNAKTVVADLEKAAKAHKIAVLDGFGEKSEADILVNLDTYKRGAIKENRLSLPLADAIATEVIEFVKKGGHVERIDKLGSLRRHVSTIGDIDLAVATTKPAEVTEHFVTYPHQKLVEKGPGGASLLLHNGRQVDLRVQDPKKYGAMLQYFSGSKNHNIQLREHALAKGLSLNEYGIKHVKTGKTTSYETEEAFYKAVGLPWIAPELREDRGEIQAALAGTLPDLPELSDIKGDLHMHTSYDLHSSHDVGRNVLSEHLDKAAELGYAYIGISDHNPSTGKHTAAEIATIMKKRQEFYRAEEEKWNKKHKKDTRLDSARQVRVFVMCEVDISPDGALALPDEAFPFVDGVVVSLHSSFTQDRETVTKRILRALEHPKVRIFGHPTGRLLGSRDGVDAHWPEVFAAAKKHDIALEINSYPDRLDLPDALVYDAVKAGIRFTIDTDSHAVEHMDLMRYGVSVARRGWASKRDILNTLGYTEFKKWLLK